MFREDIDQKPQKRIFYSNLVHFLHCCSDLYGLAHITLGDRPFPALGIDVWGIFSMPIILIIAMSNTDKDHSSLTDQITEKSDDNDSWHWIRTRFLLMNILAIIAASLGISSTMMNYIIFWGVLLLGTLIWVIPSNKNQNR